MELGQQVGGELCRGRIVFNTNSFLFKEPIRHY